MAKADPQNRDLAREAFDNAFGSSCFMRCAWTGRYQNVVRFQLADFIKADFIVTVNLRVFTQLTKILNQISI